ncbi:MAG: hypothetical protein ACRDRD_18260 [Pseudonocardiaceae bacterium]
MAASTAPSVKAALLTLLAADTGLAGVQVEYADPGEAIAQESMFYGRTIETERPDTLGQRAQRETYELELWVYVAQDGNDPQSCEERCWAVVARVESVVRANNGPQGSLSAALSPGSGWVVMGAIEMSPFTANGQRVAEALCKISVTAKK